MPRSGPQRAGSPRRVTYLPTVAEVVDERAEREVRLPNPGWLAPSPDLLTAARGDPPTNGYPRVYVAQRRRTLELDPGLARAGST